jgi:hypothetical protein
MCDHILHLNLYFHEDSELSTRILSAASQKAVIFILAAMRT